MQKLLGRWDLTVADGSETYPSWVEIRPSGGSFVGRVGSARPLESVKFGADSVVFSLPPQYESRKDNLVFVGRLHRDVLSGTTTNNNGEEIQWSAKRAPELPRYDVMWLEPISLIREDLENWVPRSPDWQVNWTVTDGLLINSSAGSDLITKQRFSDFRLQAEYKYPAGSNSGIYLRGRYEFQIVDDFEGSPNGVGNSGAIYGCIAPSVNAVRPAEEWNQVEITLIGRYVTVVLNGTEIISNQEIPGITGGALDSDEGSPGPIFLQGDHGPVTFKTILVSQGVQRIAGQQEWPDRP